MKITLGPIPFLWEKDRILSFYKEISNTPVSVVYLGEVACSKRPISGIDMLETIGRILQDAGKEVVISTLGLITNREELKFIETLCSLPFAIEVNNAGTLNICSGIDNRSGKMPDKRASGKPLIGGPHLSVYNAPTAKFLIDSGVQRIVFMPELNKKAIESISLSIPSIEKEIIVFGNLPLAFSWRCYTARALDLSKANCAIACKNYPDGMPLETMDGMSIFNINGTQLMSGKKVCMIEQLDILEGLGIEYLRIIPQAENTPDIIDIFNKVIEGVLTYPIAIETLKRYAPEGISNGWFYGEPGWEYIDKESVKTGTGQTSQPYI